MLVMAGGRAMRLVCLLWLVHGARPAFFLLSPAISMIYNATTGLTVARCAGDGEFLCANHAACVPDSRRCDGSPDCTDGSDEDNCTSRVPSPSGGVSGDDVEMSKDLCLSREGWWCEGHCLHLSWRCDGEEDCLDGSDERDCGTALCPLGGFHCGDGLCIHPDWRCDGDTDCESGADEQNCTALSPAHCELGMFGCGEGTCISASRVCNNVTDCSDTSDEGAGCNRTDVCPTSACPPGQLCRPAPAGKHVCFCPDGLKFNSSGVCVHDSPCLAGCEHRCMAERCVCPEGLEIASDNRSCVIATHTQSPVMLMSSGISIRQLRLQTLELQPIFPPASGRRVMAVAAALAGHSSVYWSDQDLRSGWTRIMRRDDVAGPVVTFIRSGLQEVSAMAWEWITGTLYFADAGEGHVAVCDSLGHCAVILRNLRGRPMALVVLPHEKTLIWADVNQEGGWIRKTGLDGAQSDTEITVLAEGETPVSLAWDFAANRLFWTDTSRRQIESCRLDGSGRRAVPELMERRPVSVAVLGATLFWSDLESEEVHSCNKHTGKNRTVVLKQGEALSLHLSALHISLQPPQPNPCAGARCSHLCLISARDPRGYRCLCADHMRMGADGFTCHTGNATRVIAGGGNHMFAVTVNTLGSDAVMSLDLLKPRDITALSADYLPLAEESEVMNLTLIYADAGAGEILHSGLDGVRPKVLTMVNSSHVTALAVDPVRGNVYWADSSTAAIYLTCTEGNHGLLLVENIRFVTSLAVSVEKLHLFASVGGSAGVIQRMALDGSRRIALITSDLLTPASLFADDASGRVYWTDAHRGVIESVRYDGDDRQALKRHLASPAGLSLASGLIFWTSLGSWDLHWTDKLALGERLTQRLIDTVATDDVISVLKLAAADPGRLEHVQRLRRLSNCSRLHCPHLCLPVAGRGSEACVCDISLAAEDDDHICDRSSCSSDQFKCRSGVCIPANQRCDGIPDCAAADDEISCQSSELSKITDSRTPVVCTARHFNCSSGERCITSVLQCDGVSHCADGSDEAHCAHRACTDEEFRCDTGFCVSWFHVCDGHDDCTDASDERACGEAPCPNGTFSCVSDGRCIDVGRVCNALRDCADGSDEPSSCPSSAPAPFCSDTERRCDDGGCVSAYDWCDGVPDCDDASDEPAACAAVKDAESPGGTGSPQRAAPGGSQSSPSGGAVIAIVLCVMALLLAGVALWYRRRRRAAALPNTHNQFHNPTFGLTPPPSDQPPQPWLGADDNNNVDEKHASGSSENLYSNSPEVRGGHIELGLGARSCDSGFLELGTANFSSKQPLVQ